MVSCLGFRREIQRTFFVDVNHLVIGANRLVSCEM